MLWSDYSRGGGRGQAAGRGCAGKGQGAYGTKQGPRRTGGLAGPPGTGRGPDQGSGPGPPTRGLSTVSMGRPVQSCAPRGRWPVARGARWARGPRAAVGEGGPG